MTYRSLPTAIAALAFALAALETQALSIAETLASANAHFPRIQAAVEARLASEGRLKNKMGAFDLALEQESLVWADGGFDGASMDTRLAKRLPTAGAKVFAGYRVTNDDFPIYQQELVTNSGGEFNAGVVFSLLRDRAIDRRRFEVNRAELGIAEAEIEVQIARIMTQRNAARAYWTWLAQGRRVAVYRELVDLAEARMSALEKRAAAGDVAQFQVIENRQNLLRRQSALTNARRDFAQAAIELSLYVRDENGLPRRPHNAELPDHFPGFRLELDDPEITIAQVLARNPDIRLLDNATAVAQAELQIARNALLPRVDVGVKTSHDVGRGSRTREGFEAIVDLTVSIPLERRLGQGAIDESQAKLRKIELDRQLASERLSNEVYKLWERITADAQYSAITADEAVQADVLVDAERQRFESGASDFFVVNLREERSADAKLRNAQALLAYFNGTTDLRAAMMDFAPFQNIGSGTP